MRVVDRRPWWMHLLAAIFAVALLFNARQEAFGPGPSGLLYTGLGADERPLAVEALVPDSPAEHAGLHAGDVLESIDGRTVASQSDWFAARAHFERGRPIAVRVRRAGVAVPLTMVIADPNWRALAVGDIVFQLTRPIVLAVALLIAYRRPFQRVARLLALILAIISVAEAFPSSGWAAALAYLPPVVSLPIAWANASWLVIVVPWLALTVSYPRSSFDRRWRWMLVMAPLAVFVPLIVLSSIAFIYQPAALAMPTPFLDSAAERMIYSIWGVMPGLMINPWPLYTPARHQWLLELWVAVSLVYWFAGCALVIAKAVRERDRPARTTLRLIAAGVVVVLVLGVHNVLTRWGVFSHAGFAVEAAVFVLLLSGLVIYSRD